MQLKFDNRTRLNFLVMAGAFLCSVSFSLIVYPRLAENLNSKIEGDGYDRLGLALYRTHTLSFFPAPSPTVQRGPTYPFFVAVMFSLGESLYPYSIQVGQALLHSFTAFLVYLIAATLWTPRRALIAASICAMHPFLLWYTPRVVTETLSTFLFTLIVFLVFRFHRSPKLKNAVLLGVVIGVASLTRQTFFPFTILVPALLSLATKLKRFDKRVVAIVVAATIVVAPWTLRNYNLTNTIIPVHTLMGFNFRQGDCLAEQYPNAPLSYMQLIHLCSPYRTVEGDTVVHWTLEEKGIQNSIRVEDNLLKQSLERYKREPGFFLRKVTLNAIMFWTISGSNAATIATSLFQIPLLFLFVFCVKNRADARADGNLYLIPVWMILFFFLSHLPIYALARFSLVLVPTMIAYCSGFCFRREV
jgi:4-amino-4-deoxy-L-arabinose transferase-like glycosyltransferase